MVKDSALLNQTSIKKPSKVARAQERMSEAVARLEKAMAARAGGELSAANVQDAAELQEMQNPELHELQDEVRRLRQENSALKQVHEQVSARLDAAIERLDATIGD